MHDGGTAAVSISHKDTERQDTIPRLYNTIEHTIRLSEASVLTVVLLALGTVVRYITLPLGRRVKEHIRHM